MRSKPPDLSAPSLCLIFDATVCELWMVLIENNIQQQNRCTAAKSREWITGVFRALLGPEHNNNNKSPATCRRYTGAKRPGEPPDGGGGGS